MAQRRMFSKQITDTDIFLDMPLSAQCLYFHLNMHADDDGFLGNAKTVRRMVGASEDDLKILVVKGFVLIFPDGVSVIRDWHINNFIRKDRYQPTIYGEDKKQLEVTDNNQYEFSNSDKVVDHRLTNGQPVVNQVVTKPDTEDRLGKDRLGKNTNINSPAKAERHISIPYKEIVDYLNLKAKTAYKSTSKATQKLIKARWDEGYKLDDFKKVIDNQVFSWQGTEYWKYMRPSTLFRASKFEGYLNANNLDKAKDQPANSGFVTNVADISSIPDDELPF